MKTKRVLLLILIAVKLSQTVLRLLLVILRFATTVVDLIGQIVLIFF